MPQDRRSFIGGFMLAGLLPGGCASASPPPPPRVGGPWAAFSARFLSPDGRIVDTGNGGISHSEGQGYGMLLAEAAGDRAGFDRMWAWTSHALSRTDVRLFSWRFDPAAANPVADPNDASDGDILIAWALLRASLRWKVAEYGLQSAAIRGAIRKHLIRQIGTRTVLLPGIQGFETPGMLTLNPSYYIWPALDAFLAADGAGAWGAVLSDGEQILAEARFGAHKLITDWIEIDSAGVRPARGKAPQFGFDAVRVPLYLAWGKRRAALAPFRDFWSDCLTRHVAIPAWVDVVSGAQAPYALSDGGMAVVDITLGRRPRGARGGDYFSTALGALAALAAA